MIPEEIKLENLDKNPIDDDNNEIKEMLKNQDSKQKMSMMFSYIMELYKCLMSSLLTIFVPQSCGGEICSISENLSRDDTFGYVTLVFNFFTLFTFLVLYLNEARREFRLIKYLDVNQTKPRDNSSVENNLLLLSNDRKNNLVLLDKNYIYSGFASLVVFLVNIGLSIAYVESNYLDSQTVTVFLTNIIFMASKLYDIYSIISTDTYVFFSAYLSRKVQFNDVDPDKKEIQLPTAPQLEESIDEPVEV